MSWHSATSPCVRKSDCVRYVPTIHVTALDVERPWIACFVCGGFVEILQRDQAAEGEQHPNSPLGLRRWQSARLTASVHRSQAFPCEASSHVCRKRHEIKTQSQIEPPRTVCLQQTGAINTRNVDAGFSNVGVITRARRVTKCILWYQKSTTWHSQLRNKPKLQYYCSARTR